MDVTRKSIGALIDELVTTNIRCWMAQDRIMDKSLSSEDRLAAAELAQKSNSKRSKLMAAIDTTLENKAYYEITDKSYDRTNRG